MLGGLLHALPARLVLPLPHPALGDLLRHRVGVVVLARPAVRHTHLIQRKVRLGLAHRQQPGHFVQRAAELRHGQVVAALRHALRLQPRRPAVVKARHNILFAPELLVAHHLVPNLAEVGLHCSMEREGLWRSLLHLRFQRRLALRELVREFLLLL